MKLGNVYLIFSPAPPPTNLATLDTYHLLIPGWGMERKGSRDM